MLSYHVIYYHNNPQRNSSLTRQGAKPKKYSQLFRIFILIPFEIYEIENGKSTTWVDEKWKHFLQTISIASSIA